MELLKHLADNLEIIFKFFLFSLGIILSSIVLYSWLINIITIIRFKRECRNNINKYSTKRCAEEGEIKSLEASKQRLETSIKSLGKLAEEMPNDITKSILKEQVAELERQKDDLENLIKQKQKKAKGLLGLFGLLG